MDLRYALYHALEEEQRAAIGAPTDPREAARILSVAQYAFGSLRGLLAGLDDSVLDREPTAGEWPIRRTLVHTIGGERSYRVQVEYYPVDTAGGALAILARFAGHRDATDRALADLPETALGRPTIWSDAEVDVRFRLHRFGSHIAEHAYQCEKAVRALGAFGGDARAIVMRIGALRGLHERRTDPARLRALDAALEETAQLAIR